MLKSMASPNESGRISSPVDFFQMTWLEKALALVHETYFSFFPLQSDEKKKWNM